MTLEEKFEKENGESARYLYSSAYKNIFVQWLINYVDQQTRRLELAEKERDYYKKICELNDRAHLSTDVREVVKAVVEMNRLEEQHVKEQEGNENDI
jgi:hypothetical protein